MLGTLPISIRHLVLNMCHLQVSDFREFTGGLLYARQYGVTSVTAGF